MLNPEGPSPPPTAIPWEVDVPSGLTLTGLSDDNVAEGLRAGWLRPEDRAQRGNGPWGMIREAATTGSSVQAVCAPLRARAWWSAIVTAGVLGVVGAFAVPLALYMHEFDLGLPRALLLVVVVLVGWSLLAATKNFLVFGGFAIAVGWLVANIIGARMTFLEAGLFVLVSFVGILLAGLIAAGVGFGSDMSSALRSASCSGGILAFPVPGKPFPKPFSPSIVKALYQRKSIDDMTRPDTNGSQPDFD